MGKLLFIGDQHWHNWSSFATIDPKTGLNSRLVNQLRLLESLARIRDEHDCTHTFWLGDWFHSRTKLDANVVSLITKKVYALWHEHDVTWLVGNHDIWGATAAEHSLSMLAPLGSVISEPARFRTADGVLVHAYPFERNTVLLKQQFEKYRWSKPDVQLIHQGLDEASVGAYNVSIKASLSVKDLPPATLTLAGHFHKPQTVSDDPKVLYVGSVMQNDMGDRMDGSRRVIILDPQTSEFTSVGLEGTPEFHLYPSLDEARSGRHREWDFVRIQCRKQEVEEAKKDFPKAQVEVVKELTKERRVISADAGQSDKALLESYVSERNPDLDPDRLLALGLQLLEDE